jgi:hypothetical protein
MTKTILYYTSNHEDPIFENKIRENIWQQKGDLPIISVSQRPINFGQNICVGDVGLSYLNEFRQILIGAMSVRTDYIIFAESDFLYPRDYFTFNPTADNYLYDNVWMVFKDSTKKYAKKPYSDGAQICKTRLVIDRFERWLDGKPPLGYLGRIRVKQKHPLQNGIRDPMFGRQLFTGEPCISFKTGNNVRNITNTLPIQTDHLDPWGKFDELKQQYL